MVRIRKLPQQGLRIEARMETPQRVLARAGSRSLRLDMPELLGGSNRGMMPLEALLAAYAGSLNVVGNFVAKTMDFQVRGLEFTISGLLDPRGMYGLKTVRQPLRTLHVEARVTTGESQRRLRRLQKELLERCPVHTLLKNAGIRIRHAWTVVAP